MLRTPGKTPKMTRAGIGSTALLLLFFAWPGQAAEPELSLEDLFVAVSQSVVLVRTLERGVIGRDQVGVVPFTDQGSGVLISADGDVLTAAHLVQVADVVQVEFADGTKVEAKIIASEPAADYPTEVAGALVELADAVDRRLASMRGRRQ